MLLTQYLYMMRWVDTVAGHHQYLGLLGGREPVWWYVA